MRAALLSMLAVVLAAGAVVAVAAVALLRRVKEAALSMEGGRGEVVSALEEMNAELQRASDGLERLHGRSSRAGRAGEV